MKIAITGGCGFVGKHLAETMSREHELVLLDISPDYGWASSIGAECRKFDVVSDDIGEDFDVLIHLAAIISVSESQEHPEHVMKVNAEGSKRMAGQAMKRNAEFILFSSAAVYGRLDRPAREDDRPNPISAYGRSKARAEEYARAYENSLIARPANIYGPGKLHPGAVEIFIEKARARSPITITGGSQTRDFIHVDDVTSAIQSLMGRHGTFNIGTGKGTSINELAETVMAIAGRTEIIRKPMPDYEIPYSVLDISKLSKFFKPSISMEKGIRRMLK